MYSIWSAINANNERFTNELFAPSDSPASLLAPSTLSKNIKCVSRLACPSGAPVSLTEFLPLLIQAVERLLLPMGPDHDPTRASIPVLLIRRCDSVSGNVTWGL